MKFFVTSTRVESESPLILTYLTDRKVETLEQAVGLLTDAHTRESHDRATRFEIEKTTELSHWGAPRSFKIRIFFDLETELLPGGVTLLRKK